MTHITTINYSSSMAGDKEANSYYLYYSSHITFHFLARKREVWIFRHGGAPKKCYAREFCILRQYQCHVIIHKVTVDFFLWFFGAKQRERLKYFNGAPWRSQSLYIYIYIYMYIYIHIHWNILYIYIHFTLSLVITRIPLQGWQNMGWLRLVGCLKI